MSDELEKRLEICFLQNKFQLNVMNYQRVGLLKQQIL